MIRAAILSLVLSIAGVGSVAAGECGKLCDAYFWKGDPTQEEVVAEIATVDVNARAEGGSTPLHWAVRRGTPTNIKVLLKAGANVNARDENGSTPLHWAAARGTPTNIKVLLKAGANVNAQDESGSTPLHYTVLWDKSANVLALLDAGADGRAKDYEGRTPFQMAKSYEILKGTDAYWRLNDAQYD